MAETIARLEAEIGDLRALGGRRREQRLIAMSLLCVLFAVVALIACADARERRSFIERQARTRADQTNRCAEMLTACTSAALSSPAGAVAQPAY